VNSTFKTVILWVTLVAVAVVLWRIIQGGPNGGKDQEIPYTEFMSDLNQNNIAEVTIEGNVTRGKLRNGSLYHSVVPATNPALLKALDDHKDVTKTTFKDSQGWNWSMALLQFSPFILLGVLWFVMIRQMQTGGNKALSFGKSRARLLSMQQKKDHFQRCSRRG